MIYFSLNRGLKLNASSLPAAVIHTGRSNGKRGKIFILSLYFPSVTRLQNTKNKMKKIIDKILILFFSLLFVFMFSGFKDNPLDSTGIPIPIPPTFYNSPFWHPSGEFIGFNHTPLKSIHHSNGNSYPDQYELERDSKVNNAGLNYTMVNGFTIYQQIGAGNLTLHTASFDIKYCHKKISILKRVNLTQRRKIQNKFKAINNIEAKLLTISNAFQKESSESKLIDQTNHRCFLI